MNGITATLGLTAYAFTSLSYYIARTAHVLLLCIAFAFGMYGISVFNTGVIGVGACAGLLSYFFHCISLRCKST